MGNLEANYSVGDMLPHHAQALRESAQAKTDALIAKARERHIAGLIPQSTGPVADESSPSASFYRRYREDCPLDPTLIEQRLDANIGDADPHTMQILREGHLQRRLRAVLAPTDPDAPFVEHDARKWVMARFKAGRRAAADIRAAQDEADRVRIYGGKEASFQERIAEPVLVLV
jgi:hypothetical protein